MPKLVALGRQISGVVLVDRPDNGHLVNHFQVEPAVDEGVGLLRIVRQQSDASQAKVF